MGVVFGSVLPSGGDLDLFSPPKNNSSWEGGRYPWVSAFAGATPCPRWGFKMNFIPHWWLRESISVARYFFTSSGTHCVSSRYLSK